MIVSTVLVLLLQTGFVLAIALGIGLFARRHPALRSASYRLAIAAAAILAIASPWLRERPHPVVPVTWVPSPIVFVPHPSVTPKARVATGVGAAPAAAVAPEAAAPFDPVPYLPELWLAGVLALTLHLAFGAVALACIHRSCQPVADPEILDAVKAISSQAGVETPRLMEGAAVANPFVAGLFRSTIYLPAAWRGEVETDVLEAVLRHEIAHVANADLAWNLLYRVVAILLWPQPLIWLFKRRMSAASEELCDRQVLAAGISGPRYAECLLTLRERLRSTPCPALGIGAVSRSSSLTKRIEAILEPGSRRFVLTRRLSAFLKIATAAAAVGAAVVFARPTGQTTPNKNPFDGWTGPYSGDIQVLSPDGKPVQGAEAWLSLTGDLPAVRSKALPVDGDRIEVSSGNLPPRTTATLVVQAKGWGLAFTQLWPAPSRIRQITLPKPVSFSGRLLQPDGSPASSVPVRITVMVRTHERAGEFDFVDALAIQGLRLSTTTATDGSFQIDGLAPDVTVGYEADDDRYGALPYKDRAKIGDGPITRVDAVTLPLAGTISGRVTHDGQPVAGLRIGAQGNHAMAMDSSDYWGEATTDQNGIYTIKRLHAGAYNLIPSLENGLGDDLTAVAREGVQVGPGQNVAGQDMQLIRGGIIEGLATDGEGKPAAEVSIGVYGPAHPSSSAWVQGVLTDAQGHYRLRVPPGKQRVYVADSRYQSDAQTVTTGSGVTRIDFHLREAITPTAAAMEDDQAPPPPQIDDSQATPAAMSFGPGSPFYGPGRLRGGGTLTLAYLQGDSTGGPTIWRPDGGTAGRADVARSLNMVGFVKEGMNPRSLFLRVDIDGLARGSYDCMVEVPQRSNWSVWQTYGDSKGRTMDMASFHAAKTLRVTDMRFGIAYGPYRTLSSCGMGQAPLYAHGSSGAATPGEDVGASIKVRVPDGIDGRDVKLDAYDRRGRKLELLSWEPETTVEKSGARTRAYGFKGALAKDIVRVDLVARDYEWVTFRGIHLYPN